MSHSLYTLVQFLLFTSLKTHAVVDSLPHLVN